MRKVLHLLGILNDSDVDWIARHGVVTEIKTGSTLIQKGTSIESIYLILSGQFSVVLGSSSSDAVATLHAGEIVGEISFVDARKPTASVIALQPSQILSIARVTLREKLETDSGFAARFYRAIAVFLANRLASTTSRYGYGEVEVEERDELPDEMMEDISMATLRFDKLLRDVRSPTKPAGF